MLTVSTRLGPYEIVAPLGAGGMGEVYRARDTRLGRDVAVKVLPEAFAGDSLRQARFEREARAVAALSHPNILALHDFGKEGAITYAVMELLEGETLRGRLNRGPLPWREAVEFGAAIADGLAAAHAKGVVHRDLKPENLFLTADGRVKILDFGLARVAPVPGNQSETGPYILAETDAGTVLGTVGYMSPEQVRGQPADARSDLFSFGCVLHEMVSGRRTFQRETAAETMTAILHDEPPDPTGSGQQVPTELTRLIRQCLAKNPSQRLQSARDLALALRSLLSDTGLGKPSAGAAKLRAAVWLVAAGVLMVFLGTSLYLLLRDGKGPEPAQPTEADKAIESLAVLPFVREGGDADADFLGNGIPITLTNSLSQLRELTVRPFSAVSRHRGAETDVPAVGRELQVQAILTGTVQKRGEDLIISVELVDVRANKQIWGESYHRKFVNHLAVQQEIARDVSAKLRLRLTGEETKRLAKRPTENLEAYRLYILGRVEWNKRTEEGLKRAVEYFQQAVREDPRYAHAYAGLSDCYTTLAYYSSVSPVQFLPKAREAALEALTIDEELAEAHEALAQVKQTYDLDFVGAASALQRAIQLNPRYASARHRHALHLAAMGREAEALAEIERARHLDPSSLIIDNAKGMVLYQARRYDEATEQYRQVLARQPSFPSGQRELGMAYLQQGKYVEAIGTLQKALPLFDRGSHVSGLLGLAYARSGQEGQSRKLLAELEEQAKRTYVAPLDIALVYMGLGDKDQTLLWLRKAFEDRSPWLRYVKVDPLFDGLRSDSRFAELLRDMGLTKPP